MMRLTIGYIPGILPGVILIILHDCITGKNGIRHFPNELGVRLFPLFLNVFSLLIIENLISKKNPILFYAIALSIAVIQITGFIAVPDIPLIFFTSLFFWCYKKFVGKLSLLNSLLLGISIALLFYSKYHAVLIVLFTLLSNVKLLAKYQTWLAGFMPCFYLRRIYGGNTSMIG
jgi:4-amino-4-deoxy-L-arabinose transferase-like glycosyltransferase